MPTSARGESSVVTQLLFEDAPQELAGLAVRQLLAELDHGRCLGRPQAFANPLLELVLTDVRAWPADDRSGNCLAPLGVRHADDRRFRHAGMIEQGIFDLARRKVLRAADDDVVESAF